jgi:hypothetical protein
MAVGPKQPYADRPGHLLNPECSYTVGERSDTTGSFRPQRPHPEGMPVKVKSESALSA